MDKNEIQKLIRDEIQADKRRSQYDVSRVPFHTHNNLDSPPINTFGSNIVSGTYTPTLTNTTNVAASTAYECQYARVFNTVIVSGRLDIDPTAAASTVLGISIPIASNLAGTQDCGGTAFSSGIAGQGAAILGDATNNRATLQYIAVDVTNQAMYFIFAYQVI